jgi:hypothetical protein
VTTVLLCACAAEAPPPEAGVYIGPERGMADLFLHDNRLIAETEGLALRPGSIRKHPGNPVFVQDEPWEKGVLNYTCVLHDVEEGAFKMWYQMIETSDSGVRRSACHYAVSKDGLHWEKPSLGIVGFQGSKANNILFVETENLRGTPSYWVIKDHAEPDPARRYKMMRHVWDFRGRSAHMGHSPDGLRWTFSEFGNRPGAIDSQNLFFWDDRAGQYVAYFRSHVGGRRSIARATSPDAYHWSRLKTVHAPDSQDPSSWHLYTPGIFKYGKARLSYVMITAGFDEVTHTMFGQLGLSRDGIDWFRFREPFLGLGGEGEWDNGSIYAIPADAEINGQVALFYKGSNKPAHNIEGGRGIGVAFLDEGGFVGWHAEDSGTLVTKPLRFADDRIAFYLLADAEQGSIRVELLNEEGNVLDGFSAEDCDEITGRGAGLEVQWKGGEQLRSHLRNGAVRLKLYLKSATVYGFRGLRPPR